MSMSLICFLAAPDNVKMQKNPKPDEPVAILIPQVRYHPSIQTKTPAARATSTTSSTSNRQKGRPGAGRPAGQADPVSIVRPVLEGEQKQKTPASKPSQKEEQTGPADSDPDQKLVRLSQKNLPRPEDVPLGLGVQLDRGVVREVEVLTRGQRTNQHWFSWRKGRITASVAHCIAHCRFVNGKSGTPPRSYLAAVTGGHPARDRICVHPPVLASQMSPLLVYYNQLWLHR